MRTDQSLKEQESDVTCAGEELTIEELEKVVGGVELKFNVDEVFSNAVYANGTLRILNRPKVDEHNDNDASTSIALGGMLEI